MNMFAQLIVNRDEQKSRYRPPASIPGKLTTRVVEYLRENPGSTAYTIRLALGGNTRRLLETLYDLHNLGVLNSRYQRPKAGCAHDRAAEQVRHYWVAL